MLPLFLDLGNTMVLFVDSNIDVIMEAVARLRINELYFSANQATPLAVNDYDVRYNLSSLKAFKYGGSQIAETLLRQIKDKYQVSVFKYFANS